MRLIHNIKVSVFEKDESKVDEVDKVLRGLFPFKVDDYFIKRKVKGVEDNIIFTFEVYIENNRLLRDFISSLKEGLGEGQCRRLVLQKESRLDETLHFFLRLDKNKMMKGQYKLTDGGNCFHIRILVASFPKKREIGLRIVDQLFE